MAKRTLNPKWKQRLELRLGGGALNEKGEYDNKEAPYTSLRLEVWDHDLLSFDEFVGEVTVPLCPLMDGRTHKYSVELEDMEGKSQAEGGAKRVGVSCSTSAERQRGEREDRVGRRERERESASREPWEAGRRDTSDRCEGGVDNERAS